MVELSFGKENFIACEGINISERGILCKTDRDVEIHSKLFLLFDVPIDGDNYEIKCDGVVLHCSKIDNGYEVGISFVDIYPEDQTRLRLFIDQLDAKMD
jgi:hypothetical protein